MLHDERFISEVHHYRDTTHEKKYKIPSLGLQQNIYYRISAILPGFIPAAIGIA